MLSWVGLVVTLLASPADAGVTRALSPDVLAPTLASHVSQRTGSALLEDWLTNLAVVRPGRGDAATGSMMLFLAVAPVGRHSVGLQAVGSF
jgi:hypothetical protein